MSKKRSNYIAAFDYVDKTLIVLSATSGEVSIASFASVIGAPVGIDSTKSFSLAFFLSKEIIEKPLKEHVIKRENKIRLLC